MPPITGRLGRRSALAIVAALVVSATALAAGAGGAPELHQNVRVGLYLLMVDDPGCPHCRRWDREIGVGYHKSPEGRLAPLVRRRMGDPELNAFRGLAYTPTFILVNGGREVGRIVGYPGADFFYQELDELLRKAGVPEDRQERRS